MSYKDYCTYCGAFAVMTRDHLIPKCRAPKKLKNGVNIVYCCKSCSKGNKPLTLWLYELPEDSPQRRRFELRATVKFISYKYQSMALKLM